MEKPLHKVKVAVLAANGFNEKEMTTIQRSFLQAGADLKIISVSQGLITGWQGNTFGLHVPVDSPLSKVLAADFDMLIVLGGDKSIAKLSETAHTNRFIKGFMLGARPVLVFNDALKLILATGLLGSQMVTGPSSLKEDVESAGALWSDEKMIFSGNIMTGQTEENELESYVSAAISHFADYDKEQEAKAA